MTKTRGLAILLAVIVVAATGTLAQRYGRRGYDDRGGLPSWQLDKEFSQDAFTFVRIQYSSGYGGRGFGGPYGRGGRRGYGRGFGGGSWAIDYRDADLNISYRLHQLTAMEVNPEGLVLELTDPNLGNYPFIHINPGDPVGVVFTDEEVKCLRTYLLNGGFLFVTDYWGEQEWDDFQEQMRRVFPDREPVELDLSHPIFHCVFDLKEKPQVSAIEVAMAGRGSGITWEHDNWGDTQEVHYRAYHDDKGRMVALLCHNNDLTDGWEREGENEWYFHEFAEKRAYPMGINIIVYAMTH
ncbi:MAG: DUF4159 domain-containing protein [Phycisphaerae bacterium]|nr:DUF4159 domain-containing protein [Phycisphaerae bacterium]